MSDNFEEFNSPTSHQPAPPFRLEASSSSPELGKIFEALSKAQGLMSPAVMDKRNSHFNTRYASLTASHEAMKVPLTIHGLSILQQVFSLDGRYFIRTILGHASGQWISNVFEILLDKKNMQGLGSAITYGRRYALNALICVVDTDDDGEAAVGSHDHDQEKGKPQAPVKPRDNPQPPVKPRDNPPPPEPKAPIPIFGASSNGSELISLNEIGLLVRLKDQRGWTDEQLKEYMIEEFNVSSLKALTRDQYDSLMEAIRTKWFHELSTKGRPEWDPDGHPNG